MSADSQWREKYGWLKEYTEAHPEIHIDTCEVSIPGHLRDGFYERFDAVRNAIVESRLDALPVSVDTLRGSYIQAEKEVTALLGLDRIDIPVDLLSFLHDPKAGLVRVLYNRLFELVQGKLDQEVFERMAQADIDAVAGEFFRLGYETWAALALILLLEPDKAYGVALDEEFEPFVCELKEIAFGRQFHHVAKRIPEFILHSKKLDRNVAVKMPLVREVETYYIPFEQPVKPKKRTGDTSYVLDARMMFLSAVPDLGKIPVFADIHTRTIKGPDLTIEFMTPGESQDPESLEAVKNRVGIMQPNLGGCVVLIDPDREPVAAGLAENVEVIAAGFDPARLKPIIDRLS